VFVADPSAPGADLHLVRAVHRAFAGPAEFRAEPEHRAQVTGYLSDLARVGERDGREIDGHSYGEMAAELIASAVRPDEPVDLLILAFDVHDVRPGRPTAAYLSHLTPGAPMAFAVCDQGSAAAFSGLRIARGYAASAGVRRALLVVVEQGALPYECPVPLPAEHRGAALLFEAGAIAGARVVGVRQHRGEFGGLTERADTLVLGHRLAAMWTGPAGVRTRVGPAGQPSTGVWSALVDELPGEPGLLVAADYDPDLRYLSVTTFETPV
jgi:hypothetical protein